MPFADRTDAGRRLAARISTLVLPDVVVLGLPRGGVPVAFEVAQALGAPLDVILVRKLGVPMQPELAMGAIGEDGVRIANRSVLTAARVSQEQFAAVEAHERAELVRRAAHYRAGRRRLPLEGRTAVVVDDGIATGSTAVAACEVARAHGARRVVLAVPVASRATVHALRPYVDDLVCLQAPDDFVAVGRWYADFSPTSDEEVVALLARAKGAASSAAAPTAAEKDVALVADGQTLHGSLFLPASPAGVVLFAHGSGSSRHSPRNRTVAAALQAAGYGTLLFDLLTTREETDRQNVFDIALLGRRLLEATTWVRTQPGIGALPIGYFGASTGAGAALGAAGAPDADVGAVVSRGGRPDLAGTRLGAVRAPTLLIVGGRDPQVLDLNRRAQAQLRCPSDLAVVPGATHLFEEPGALQAVARLARSWFDGHLALPSHREAS